MNCKIGDGTITKCKFGYLYKSGIYFNVKTNKLLLAFFLWGKLKPFNIVDDRFPRYKFIPKMLIKAYRILSFILSLKKDIKNNNEKIIELPINGQVALYSKRQNHYKIFNLNKKFVTTMYKKNNHKRIKCYKKIGEHELGPKILKVNEEEGWYVEEYLNFPHYKTREHTSVNYNQVILFILRIINKYKIVNINLEEYISTLKLDVPKHFEKNNTIISKVRRADEFLTSLTMDLLVGKDKEKGIYLTLTHGDLHLGNIVKTERGILGIDWEFCKRRSLLYDIYFFMFKTTKNPEDVNILLNKLGEEGIIKTSDIDLNLYLKIFYLEYVSHWLNVVFDSQYNLSNEKINSILDWILEDINKIRESENKNCDLAVKSSRTTLVRNRNLVVNKRKM